MQLCVIIELCVLDNTLQKLVGPIFASTLVCSGQSVRSTGGTLVMLVFLEVVVAVVLS